MSFCSWTWLGLGSNDRKTDTEDRKVSSPLKEKFISTKIANKPGTLLQICGHVHRNSRDFDDLIRSPRLDHNSVPTNIMEKLPPFFAEGYKGTILMKVSRKWEDAYRRRLPLFGMQPITIMEEILLEYFPDEKSTSSTSLVPPILTFVVRELSSMLRAGGFTMPWIRRMEHHFGNVAKTTGCPSSLPLHYSVFSWAKYWLIDCIKGTRDFPVLFSFYSSFYLSPNLSDDTTDSSIPFNAPIEHSEISDHSKARKSSRPSKSRKWGSNAPSSTSKGRSPSSNTTSSSSSSSSTPTNPLPGIPSKGKITVGAMDFLADDKVEGEIIWKGASTADLNLFQGLGGKWDRELHRRCSGDLSVAPAIYYSNNRRYALAWGGYKIPPTGWQKNTLQGAVVFEAVLKPTTLKRVDLQNTTETQSVIPQIPFLFSLPPLPNFADFSG